MFDEENIASDDSARRSEKEAIMEYIEEYESEPLEEGATYYLIAKGWFDTWYLLLLPVLLSL